VPSSGHGTQAKPQEQAKEHRPVDAKNPIYRQEITEKNKKKKSKAAESERHRRTHTNQTS
jgi:hypothetical protein